MDTKEERYREEYKENSSLNYIRGQSFSRDEFGEKCYIAGRKAGDEEVERRYQSIYNRTIGEDTIFEKLTLKPGDVIVIKIPSNTSHSDILNLSNKFKSVWPDNKVIFVQDSIELAIISKEEALSIIESNEFVTEDSNYTSM